MCVYVYVYVCMYVYMYIYTYIYRERERDGGGGEKLTRGIPPFYSAGLLDAALRECRTLVTKRKLGPAGPFLRRAMVTTYITRIRYGNSSGVPSLSRGLKVRVKG